MTMINKQYNIIYSDAEDEIVDIINQYIDDITPAVDQDIKDREAGIGIWTGLTVAAADRLWQQRMIRRFTGSVWTAARSRMANILTKADVAARSVLNPTLYAAAEKMIGKELKMLKPPLTTLRVSAPDFTIYNKDALKRLRKRQQMIPQLKISTPKSDRYYNKRIQRAVKAGIRQGKTVEDIAKHIGRIAHTSERSSLLSARTAVNGAENAGRQVLFETLAEKGIIMEKEWLPAHDGKTRDSHIKIDGERVPYDGVFSNGCRFPGDPKGPPKEVWNCRCGMRAIIKGVNDKK